jgi:hypothetical protein
MDLIPDQLPNLDPVLTPDPILTRDPVLVWSLNMNPDPNYMVLNPDPAMSMNGSKYRLPDWIPNPVIKSVSKTANGLKIGWSMKFRKISQKNSFRISRNSYVYFAKFFEILSHEISFRKINEIFARNFHFLLDEVKNNVAVTEQKIAASFSSPFST